MNRVSCQLLKIRWPHGLNWLLFSVLIVLSAINSSRAQTVITNGSDLSILTNGGRFTFETNGTFVFSNAIVLRADTEIDGTGLDIVLSGGNVSRLFTVTNFTLKLTSLQITAGKNPLGGAIYNYNGTIAASNVVFNANHATNAAGANGLNGTSGSIDGGNGAAGAAGEGGAIFSNQGSLLLINCTFTNNLATGGIGGTGGNGFNGVGGYGGSGGDGGVAYGGAIYSTGKNIIIGCYFVNNVAYGGSAGAGGAAGTGPVSGSTGAGGQGAVGRGGAIYIPAGGFLNVTNSSFIANRAFGGDSAPQLLSGNGISANGKTGGAGVGGAINNFGLMWAENCTFWTNSCIGGAGGWTLGDANANAGPGGSAIGGAIANGLTFFARNCTFATNNAIGGTPGISVYTNRNGAAGTVYGGNLARTAGTSKIFNCILQHGRGPDNYGTLSDGDYNISSDTSCAFTSPHSLSKTDVHLLENLTFVTGHVAPILEFKNTTPKNPAMDFIPPLPSSVITNFPAQIPTNFPATDEIGFPRYIPGINTNADAGAFEFQPTAPRIALQPVSQAVAEGSNATFVVSANGVTPMTNQWYFNGNLLPSATNTTLIISNTASTNLGTYFVVISNTLGGTTSSNATLSFANPPVIQSLTPDRTISSGSNVVLTVTATGAPLNYQWYFTNRPLSDVANHIVGSTTSSLTLTNVTRSDQGTYTIVVSNVLSAVSNSVHITITDPGIVSQPASLTRAYGVHAVFSVVGSSITNLTYQWRNATNHLNIIGATQSSYTNAATASGSFEVVLTNALGTVTSSVATLTVLNPGITKPPTNMTVNVGASAAFDVAAAASTTNLTYQWAFNGSPIPGQTSTNYTLANADISNAGTYSVTVTAITPTATNTTTASATLTVLSSASISGRITFGTNGVANVSVSNGNTNVITDVNGGYAFTKVTNGSYTVTPVPVGSGLTPASIPVSIVGSASTSNINFSFNPPLLQITAAPTNDVVPVHVLGAPVQQSSLQSSTDLTNWTNAVTFFTDTNGTQNVTVTNSLAVPEFFLRLISP